VKLFGNMNEINRMLPYVFYRPNTNYNGLDTILIQVCDITTNANSFNPYLEPTDPNLNLNRNPSYTPDFNPNNNPNYNPNSNATSNTTSLYCGTGFLPLIIDPQNDPPSWSTPRVPIIVTENKPFNFLDNIQGEFIV
jgi:hypothetical protein